MDLNTNLNSYPRQLILLILLLCGINLHAQNLVVNGSMTGSPGEGAVASGWIKATTSFVNTPDLNDEAGPARTTPGYIWYNGVPVSSPDGGTWQNVIDQEDFTQTITGLTVGGTYYFRYYYCTQGIAEPYTGGLQYVTPGLPRVTVTGAIGYTDPVDPGPLFSWNTCYVVLTAISPSITITAKGGISAYLAYDGFYLSATPLSFPLVTLPPQDMAVCMGGNAKFSVQASDVTDYQWQINNGTGWIDITDNAQYIGSKGDQLLISGVDASLNADQFRCKLNNTCCQAYSSAASLAVITPEPPTISISTPVTSICAGVATKFTANTTNADPSAKFSWLKNGQPAGANNDTYSDNTLIDGDKIQCVLTSSGNCSPVVSVPSNTIEITVHPVLTPTVSIQASANNICSEEPVKFTATASSAGSSPGYQWLKNGTIVGGNNDTYTDNSPGDGDRIECLVISSYVCPAIKTSSSNSIMMTVTPSVSPQITIVANTPGTCAGSSVIFKATVTNAGPAPSYQWKKNGQDIGKNAAVFETSGLTSTDVVTCVLKDVSSVPCLLASTATSNAITTTITPNPIVKLNKSTVLCFGEVRTLDAGLFQSYLWNDGSNAETLNIDRIGKYYVTVRDENGCMGSDTTVITKIKPLPHNFLPADTALCSFESVVLSASENYSRYRWNTGSAEASVQPGTPGIYWLEVSDRDHCTGRDTIIVSSKECPYGFFIPNAFTPNGDGSNDTFRPLLYAKVKKYEFFVFDRWGNLIFRTSNPSASWDGKKAGIQQKSDTFVWLCNYQFDGEPPAVKRGTVILIR